MPQKAAKPTVPAPGAALIALHEKPHDASLLAAIVGSGHAKTQVEVGRAFGVQPATVRQSWVPSGMPGSPGRYPLAEIAAWRLKHLDDVKRRRREAGEQSNSELKRRLLEGEAKKVELQAERLEREEAEAIGDLVRHSDVVTAWRQHASVLAERLNGIPDLIAPRLPQANAADLVEEIRGTIQRELTAYSELGSKALRVEDA